MTTAAAGALGLADAMSLLPEGAPTHFIDGEFAPAAGDDWVVRNPADANRLCTAGSGTSGDVDRAVAAARRAQPGWASATPRDRAEILFRIAEAIEDSAEDLARLESLNTGKPIMVSREEMPLAADALRFFAGAARTAVAAATGEYVAGHVSTVRREPIGVVGIVAPWNYPLMTAVWKIAPALAAGNTVVLKPSEMTPLTAMMLCRLSVGVLPPGVVNVVLGTGPIAGAALAAHPEVDLISLTGSVASGRAVARAASASLKRVHLELGGKAPVVVLDDADVAAVARTVRVAGFWNSGQECGAATRVLAHHSIKADLEAALVEQLRDLRCGNPDDGDHVELGPLISAAHRSRVHAMVAGAVADHDARLLTGGSIPDGAGYHYPPTVLTDVAAGSPVSTHEIFGPVVTVEAFTDVDEAITRANSVEYGLSASVWTRSLTDAATVSDALDFGTVWINSHLVLSPEMPWSGFKSSGYGRDLSIYGLDDYVRTKHVMANIAHPE